MEKKDVSAFLLSLVSTLSSLDNKKEVIDHLLKGLNSAFEHAEFEFCRDGGKAFPFFKFYNGEGIKICCSSSLSRYDQILIQESVDIVSAFLEKIEFRERSVCVQNKYSSGFSGENERNFPNRRSEFAESRIIKDVTNQKKTEGEVLLLSHAMEQSPMSIVITDCKGRIEYVNRAFTSVSGFSANEAVGQDISIVKSDKQTGDFYENLWNTILGGQEWTGELINKRRSGEEGWEHIVISPIRNSEGVVTHFVSFGEDITDKKKLFDDLVGAKEKAEESDRLKTAFLANISHEIRTPMNGILGFLELLKNPDLGEKEKDAFIEVVNKSGDRLLSTINDLIEISKIESGQVKTDYSEVNIQELMQYYLDFFSPTAKNQNLGIEIACQIQGEKALIKTDRAKVESALSNLISNAIKFTPKGKIEFGNYIENDSLIFFVKDTGIGIAPEHMDAVFDRFVQADLNMTKPYQGTGLGLSIIKGYIRLLNGKIWVESKEGKGSIFYFSIPYYSSIDR